MDPTAFARAVAELAALVDEAGRRRFTVLLGTRSAGIPLLRELPDLGPAVDESPIAIEPLTIPQLSEAITGPAAAAGIHVDPNLVQLLIADLTPYDIPDLAHDLGSLTWLADALRETWEVSRRGRMTVADYQQTGGIQGLINAAAEATWSDLDEVERPVARGMLLRMVAVDDASAVTRRALPMAELEGLAAATGEARLARVLERFVARRLVTIEGDTVRIGHPALLTAWPRLAEWVNADRGGLRQFRRLSDSTTSWHDHGRDPSYVARGARLAVITEWIDQAHPDLTRTEQAFVDASVRASRDAERSRRRQRRRLQVALALSTVLMLVAAGMAVFALRARSAADARALEATQARNDAQSRELSIAAERLRDTDPALAAQLSLVAYRIAPTPDARSAVLDSTAIPTPTRIPAQDGPTSIALDADRGILAVTQARDGSVAVWSVQDPREPSRVASLPTADPGSQQFSLAISPDGRQLAAGNADGLIQRWDISDPSRPRVLDGPGRVFPTGVLSIAFSPDGATLAAGGAGGAVQRWDVSDPAVATTLAPLDASEVVGAVTFSPDGSRLWAGGDDGTLWSWALPDAATPERRQVGDSQINTIAIDPGGTTLVTGDKGGAVSVWHRTGDDRWQRDPEDPIPAMTGWVSTADFNADGTRLVLGSTGSSVMVVDMSDFTVLAAREYPGPVTSVGFDGAGTVVVADTDGYTRLAPVPGSVIGPVGTPVFGVAHRSDSELLVSTGSAVNRLLSYDQRDRERPVRLAAAAPGDDVVALDGALALSTDGTLAAGGAADGRVQLFTASDGGRLTAAGPSLQVGDGVVQSLAFSPDGSVLAVGGNDQTIHLWDVSDPAHPQELLTTEDTGGQVYALDFGPDGRLLAAGTTAGEILLWDISDPRHATLLTTFGGDDGYVFGVRFSPDGSVLATAGAGRVVSLWDVADPRHPTEIGSPLSGPTNDIEAIRFDRTGDRLAAVSDDGVVWIWDTSDITAPEIWARLHAASGILYATDFSPDGTHLVAAGSSQLVWDWSVDVDDAIGRLCAEQGIGITPHEWDMYVAERSYRSPCGES